MDKQDGHLQKPLLASNPMTGKTNCYASGELVDFDLSQVV